MLIITHIVLLVKDCLNSEVFNTSEKNYAYKIDGYHRPERFHAGKRS